MANRGRNRQVVLCAYGAHSKVEHFIQKCKSDGILLLIPCLSPLLLTLLVGGLNLGKAGTLRILTWDLPKLPIGVWMAMAATSGAVLGSGGVLAAGSSTQQTLQRERKLKHLIMKIHILEILSVTR